MYKRTFAQAQDPVQQATEQEILQDLQALQKATSTDLPASQFCCSGYVKSMPNISIGDAKETIPISFPCTINMCQEWISKFASKAPFGLAEKTIVDEQVRKGWQIPANLVHFYSKAWQNSLQEQPLLQSTKELLAPKTANVQAKFYKMLMYMQGDFFKPHKDTLRESRHFATLVVFLPSYYTGGELCVRHQGKEFKYQHSLQDANEQIHPLRCQWVAFYTDCEHEILPVTSGCRVALTYNLFYNGTHAPELPNVGTNPLLALLDKLYSKPFTQSIGVLCAHQYSIASLSPTNLKGTDASLYFTLVNSGEYHIILDAVDVGASGNGDDDDDAQSAFDSDDFPAIGITSIRTKKNYFADNVSRSQLPLVRTKNLNQVQFLCDFSTCLDKGSGSAHSTGNEGVEYDLQYQWTAMIISKKNVEPPAKKQKVILIE